MSYLNKTKIENILKKSNNNIVQYKDGKHYISDEYCIWIDHDGEFFEEDKYLKEKTEVPEKERKSIKSMMDKLIHTCLEKSDYWKVNTEEKCKLTYNTGKTEKCVLLKNGDWDKLIKEKYYNTFKKGSRFLISKENFIVFVTDKEGLLIGAMSSLFMNDGHIEM